MQQFVLRQDWLLRGDKRMLKYHFYKSQTLEVNNLLSRIDYNTARHLIVQEFHTDKFLHMSC